MNTLMIGVKGLFNPDNLTPMQKITLLFIVMGLIFYGFAVVEGILMRIYEVHPIPGFFAILTAHPLVGIFIFNSLPNQ